MKHRVAKLVALTLLTLLAVAPAAAAPPPAAAPPDGFWSHLTALWSRVKEGLVGAAEPRGVGFAAKSEDPAGGEAAEAVPEEPVGYFGPGPASTTECTEECGDSELGGPTADPGG